MMLFVLKSVISGHNSCDGRPSITWKSLKTQTVFNSICWSYPWIFFKLFYSVVIASYLYTAITNLLYLDALLIHLWKHYKNDKFSGLYLNGLFQKKYRLRTWNFQGYWSKSMWKFQGSVNKEVEFWGVLKKNSWGISMGHGFWPYNFQGVSHNFLRISKVKVANLKIPKKFIINPPCMDFFWNNPIAKTPSKSMKSLIFWTTMERVHHKLWFFPSKR